jgi:glycosyltransferase involved in cell wall biosynthesis
MIDIVTFSTLYPNAAQPNHGIFVENRLRHLLQLGGISARVIAPVPFFPFASQRFGQWAAYAQVPSQEFRHGLSVIHPRYLSIPKVGMSLAPLLLAAGALNALQTTRRAAAFDLIDAHYFYPDGVAAVMLGSLLRKPVVVTARGTDVNLIPQHRLPRFMIRAAAKNACGIVAVSQAIKDQIVRLGIPESSVSVLRNGVDLKMFHPEGRTAARANLGVSGPTLLSVGLLIGRKGHHHIIEALRALTSWTLLIAGEGPERAALGALARTAGVADRVRFLGAIPHEKLQPIYAAADALVLASSREGWPNVLLESMACGTPVVASAVWGIPEVVATAAAGVLMPSVSAAGVVVGVEKLLANPPDRNATRSYAEKFGWDATSVGQRQLFERVVASYGDRRRS